MADDIETRLGRTKFMQEADVEALCDEAAVAIERLRAAGDALVDALDGSRNQIREAADRWNEARK